MGRLLLSGSSTAFRRNSSSCLFALTASFPSDFRPPAHKSGGSPKRTVLIVFAVLALVLFFIIWQAWEAMMAAAIGAGALILLGLLIMAFSGGGNTGVQKLTLVRQNGKRFTFNPYLSSISNELRAQYIEAQQEAATVLKHLQVPELPAG